MKWRERNLWLERRKEADKATLKEQKEEDKEKEKKKTAEE
jgi:hypothetical protein